MIKNILHNIYARMPISVKRVYRYLKKLLPASIPRIIDRCIPNKKILCITTKSSLTFLSIGDMAACIDKWIVSIPRDIDVVVGIPRSGLLIANVIAQKLGKPLTTPDALVSGQKPWISSNIRTPLASHERYLLVDDSVRSGTSMRNALAQLRTCGINRSEIIVASLIVSQGGKKDVDAYYACVDGPRFFEWNMLHKNMSVVSDMDGVLCENPPDDTWDDEEAYILWLQKAGPLFTPTFQLEAVLTSRIDKYRDITVAWLKDNNIHYNNLIMSSCKTRKEQRKEGLKFKVRELEKKRPQVYWESTYHEAIYISQNVQTPVLSVDRMVLLPE